MAFLSPRRLTSRRPGRHALGHDGDRALARSAPRDSSPHRDAGAPLPLPALCEFSRRENRDTCARGPGLPGVPNVREDPRERRLVLKESRRAYLRRNSTPAAASIAPTAIINCASGLHPAPKLVALYPVRP